MKLYQSKCNGEHEIVALSDYLFLQSAVTSLSVTPSELTLLPSHPILNNIYGVGIYTDSKLYMKH